LHGAQQGEERDQNETPLEAMPLNPRLQVGHVNNSVFLPVDPQRPALRPNGQVQLRLRLA